MRRECLFDVTCSEVVLQAACSGGTISALRAFVLRLRTCRGDYSVGSADGVPHALTRNGVRLELQQLAPATRKDVELAYAQACAEVRLASR